MITLRVFELEFDYFSGSEWKNISVKITSESKIQLMKAFLNEVSDIHEPYSILKTINQEEQIKHKWNDIKNDIYYHYLIFPIITRQ